MEVLMARIGRQIALIGLIALAMVRPALTAEPPKFQVDPSWPKTLPNNWIFGQIGGIFVDAQDHVWVNQRPGTLDAREKRASTTPNVRCCKPAPSVVEFDQEGNVVQAWGGPGQGYDWPANEHGIFVDHNNFVWVAGNGMTDGLVLKFTRAGKFVLQIGKSGMMTSSADTTQLGRPADMVVDPATNELFVADGYFNHRVIVFDAATGAFKRMWGAYGKPPTDDKLTYDPKAAPAQQFNNPVHGIRLTKDGMVVVSDRGNNRIQVFRKDGTFVKEYQVLKDSPPGTVGSVMLWPDAANSYFVVSDDPNGEFHVIRRSDGVEVSTAGRVGTNLGQFMNLHNLAIDSKGNVYSAEVQGKRVQRFRNLSGL
jgi:DNA-binding beta-propeller fold protein YncE